MNRDDFKVNFKNNVFGTNALIYDSAWARSPQPYTPTYIRVYCKNLDPTTIHWIFGKYDVTFSIQSIKGKIAARHDWIETWTSYRGYNNVSCTKLTLHFDEDCVRDIPEFEERFSRAFKHLIRLCILEYKKEKF